VAELSVDEKAVASIRIVRSCEADYGQGRRVWAVFSGFGQRPIEVGLRKMRKCVEAIISLRGSTKPHDAQKIGKR
jgi:hypothetical protein